MRLELNIIKIKDVQFGDQTHIDNGVLTINRDELQKLLAEDKRLTRVDVELARPGESCRIFNVADVVEPRAKVESGRDDLQGSAGKHAATGQGITCVLRGAAVVMCDTIKGWEGTTSIEPRNNTIEMSGPGSEVSIYSQMMNIVLLPCKKESATVPEFQTALKIAGLKTADYLARAGKDLKPDEQEIFEIPPLSEITQGLEGLPKVTYIAQILSLQFEPAPGEPTFFGTQAGGIMPTILHPNQVLDGAVTSAHPGLNVQTYRMQNHPIIKELYQRHGKDLCFAGVIATVAHNNVFDFDRMANIAASLAKYVIGADGAVLTKTGGGAPELAMAYTARRCEQLGIKTVIAMMHMGADFKDARFGATTIFSMPELDAIVSMGFPFETLILPPVEKVIGRTGSIPEKHPLDGEFVQAWGSIYGSICQIGSSKLTSVRY